MSEWPKPVYVNTHGEVCSLRAVEEERPENDEIEVIPAEIGRELYEAARAHQFATLNGYCGMCGGKNQHEHGCMTGHAIARYEREVGDG